jgi:lysine-N-methylase
MKLLNALELSKPTVSCHRHNEQQKAAPIIEKMLSENIDEADGCACFRLTEDERCPFLQEDGLCRLICECGEESLCQICADHPRFRNFFSDRTEIGLGMCCEAAARLILTWEEPVSFAVIDGDEEEAPLTHQEDCRLCLRDALIERIQKRRRPFEKRTDSIFCYSKLHTQADRPLGEWVDFLLGLEHLEDAWFDRLRTLTDCEASEIDSRWDVPFEQLMVYLFYRHLGCVREDDDTQSILDFCLLMWRIIRELFARAPHQTMEELVEICRLYSSEIEYSDENIAAILGEIIDLTTDRTEILFKYPYGPYGYGR